MNKTNKNLTLAVDMNGCPNKCKHCWLGHLPNKIMDENADIFIVNYFKEFFNTITFYSWLREPDFCRNYEKRWIRDNQISVNSAPQRFELASFYRLVCDENYVEFLKKVNVNKVQLTFFGLEEMTDKYVGRHGAFNELIKATEILISNKIAPRWQAFINSENSIEIVQLLQLSKQLKLKERCSLFGQDFQFFVHAGSCDGENRKLYDIRIAKKDIPKELIPFYANFNQMYSESELCNMLCNDKSNFTYHNETDIVLNISNTFDAFFNFTHMTNEWKIGNIKSESADEIVARVLSEDIPAINLSKNITVSDLIKRYGDSSSEKAFEIYDYKSFLLNEYVAEMLRN